MTEIEIIERFAEFESHIAGERGAFALFALFMLEEVPDRWDLIVAAPWTGDDKQGAVDYLIGQIKSRIGEQGLLYLARIVVVDPQHPAVQALNRSIRIQHGRVEIRDSNFFGLPVKRAHFITSQRLPEPAAA